MVKNCYVCFDVSSWRFHSFSRGTIFFNFVCQVKELLGISIEVNNPNIALCNACYGSLSRFMEYTTSVRNKR